VSGAGPRRLRCGLGFLTRPSLLSIAARTTAVPPRERERERERVRVRLRGRARTRPSLLSIAARTAAVPPRERERGFGLGCGGGLALGHLCFRSLHVRLPCRQVHLLPRLGHLFRHLAKVRRRVAALRRVGFECCAVLHEKQHERRAALLGRVLLLFGPLQPPPPQSSACAACSHPSQHTAGGGWRGPHGDFGLFRGVQRGRRGALGLRRRDPPLVQVFIILELLCRRHSLALRYLVRPARSPPSRCPVSARSGWAVLSLALAR
jgi:hypothetical protein